MLSFHKACCLDKCSGIFCLLAMTTHVAGKVCVLRPGNRTTSLSLSLHLSLFLSLFPDSFLLGISFEFCCQISLLPGILLVHFQSTLFSSKCWLFFLLLFLLHLYGNLLKKIYTYIFLFLFFLLPFCVAIAYKFL